MLVPVAARLHADVEQGAVAVAPHGHLLRHALGQRQQLRLPAIARGMSVVRGRRDGGIMCGSVSK